MLAAPVKLTSEAAQGSGKRGREDVSAVKRLSGYVNAGRRQEHSEDTALWEKYIYI